MNIKFSIKNTEGKAEKEGDSFLRFTGVSEPFRRVSERTAKKIGQESNGDPRLQYVTGLDTTQTEFFSWYKEDERKEVAKQIKALKPRIANYFGGDTVLSSENKFFWGEDTRVSKLSLRNENLDVFFDTKNPIHALLYLSIISGAFIDLVAPTKDWAERHQLPHYLALETDDTFEDEDDITRSDAHGALSELRKEDSPEALFILAWCIQYDTQAYGANLRSTPIKDLINYHIKYIDGKLVTKRKRNTPKIFMEYVEKWKGQQTRPQLYIEAYVKAGEYYNFVQQRDKKYVTAEGTILGNTIEEAVEALQKPKFTVDFENLRDKVEQKWKE